MDVHHDIMQEEIKLIASNKLGSRDEAVCVPREDSQVQHQSISRFDAFLGGCTGLHNGFPNVSTLMDVPHLLAANNPQQRLSSAAATSTALRGLTQQQRPLNLETTSLCNTNHVVDPDPWGGEIPEKDDQLYDWTNSGDDSVVYVNNHQHHYMMESEASTMACPSIMMMNANRLQQPPPNAAAPLTNGGVLNVVNQNDNMLPTHSSYPNFTSQQLPASVARTGPPDIRFPLLWNPLVNSKPRKRRLKTSEEEQYSAPFGRAEKGGQRECDWFNMGIPKDEDIPSEARLYSRIKSGYLTKELYLELPLRDTRRKAFSKKIASEASLEEMVEVSKRLFDSYRVWASNHPDLIFSGKSGRYPPGITPIPFTGPIVKPSRSSATNFRKALIAGRRPDNLVSINEPVVAHNHTSNAPSLTMMMPPPPSSSSSSSSGVLVANGHHFTTSPYHLSTPQEDFFSQHNFPALPMMQQQIKQQTVQLPSGVPDTTTTTNTGTIIGQQQLILDNVKVEPFLATAVSVSPITEDSKGIPCRKRQKQRNVKFAVQVPPELEAQWMLPRPIWENNRDRLFSGHAVLMENCRMEFRLIEFPRTRMALPPGFSEETRLWYLHTRHQLVISVPEHTCIDGRQIRRKEVARQTPLSANDDDVENMAKYLFAFYKYWETYGEIPSQQMCLGVSPPIWKDLSIDDARNAYVTSTNSFNLGAES